MDLTRELTIAKQLAIEAADATDDVMKNLLKKLPNLEKELDAFASDIAEISNNQPLMPTVALWE